MSRVSFYKSAGRPVWRSRLIGGLLALILLPAFASAQSVEEKYQRAREQRSQFNLAAGPTSVLRVNQYQCGLQSDGPTCTDVFDSPTGGGGFWPTGSPNQYMFNSGLQIAGIIPIAPDCSPEDKLTQSQPDCFAWSGDTTGAFFFDASGRRQHGTALTNIYDSLNEDDFENWPSEGTFADFPNASAYVQDTELFNDVLIGRKAASQQDSWVMYWDGDPTKTGGRTHPMGILVEQRSLAWNYPTGNENVIYFIYKFTNVTGNPLFQRLNETRYAIELPDAGWRIDSIYVAYAADPDVTSDAGLNHATAILPFNMGVAYMYDFIAGEFVYPPDLFYPPFYTNAPGIVAMQYLKSPIDPATGEEVGLTSFSLTTNGGRFTDPPTVQAGWRYLSLNVDEGKGDPPCSFPDAEVQARNSCFLGQNPADVRMFVGSGPFALNAGESATIAVAQYAAATVAGTVVPGVDNKPGFPAAVPDCGAANDTLRDIERAAGWISHTCPAAGEELDLFDVEVVPMSLLARAQVAQSIFSNKFLLGFAPDSPPFYLVPGDDRVTVVWEPSATDETGDPFFAAAGDEENPLYDPNYRQFDVEGYRIYRGTTPANMRLIAQFDKSGTVFTDYLCVTDPEHPTADECDDIHEVDITGPFVQYTSVLELANGDPIVTAADTAMAEQIAAGNAVPLSNTGVPYSYVDTDVRNGFQYFYRVTAFDINSVRSGPTSLESAAAAKSVVPIAPTAAIGEAEIGGFFLGGRGTELDPEAANHTINPTTGTFSGPAAPATSFDNTTLSVFVSQLVPEGTFGMIRLDSILPGYYEGTYYFTNVMNGGVVSYHADLPDHPVTFDLGPSPLLSDAEAIQEQRDQGLDPSPIAGAMNSQFTIDLLHYNSSDSDFAYKVPGFWTDPWDPQNTAAGGSRWFEGTTEATADPTLGDFTAGSLPGITAIFQPQPYAAMASHAGLSSDLYRRFLQSAWPLHRAADMRVYWGATGIDSVIDVTHNVPVEFSTHFRAAWGFIPDTDGDDVLTWGDLRRVSGTEGVPSGFSLSPKTDLSQTPVVTGVDVTGDLASDGSGFALLITGEPFYFQGAPPAAGTVWTLRTYYGEVRLEDGTYAFLPSPRNANVPGLVVGVEVASAGAVVAANADLDRVHTVPDPYYVASIFDLSPTSKELQFVNLPPEATIRIYSLSGVLVDMVTHSDASGGGRATWDLRNRSDQFVASGVYLYHVSTPDGRSRVGKFTVVNSTIAR